MSRYVDSNTSPQGAFQSSRSVPSSNEMPTEDDPRTIQDRKEKKKVQNRIAQRTYRNRMKARLEQLEARLEPRGGKADGRTETIDTSSRSMASESPLEPMDENLLSTLVTPQHLSSSENDQSPVRHTAHLGIQGHVRNGEMNSLYFHNNVLAQTSQHSERSSLNIHPSKDGTNKSPQELFLDILSSQSQLISKLDHFYQETKGGFNRDRAPGGTVDIPSNGLAFPSLDSQNSFAFTAQTQRDSELWGQDVLISQMGETPARSEYPTPQLMGSSDSHSDVVELMTITDKQVSLDERLESILEHTAKLGFAHFDWAAVEYYSHTFDESSSMANEQRMSRNRRLPAVLARVFSAATDWSEWERRGFYEEVVKMTESLLISEASASQPLLEEKLSPLVDLYAKDQVPSTPNPTLIRREIENNLPNLWALVMALTLENRGLRPNDRSKVAVATILLLSYAGRLAKHQLLSLLGALLV